MTEPLSAATRPRRRRPAAGTFDAVPNRPRGRWPATDQLTGPFQQQPAADLVDAGQAVAAELNQQTVQHPQPDPTVANLAEDPPRDVAAERPSTFAERMIAIDAQFTNPSTGETSVDQPLVTIDVHEFDYDNDAPTQRHSQSATHLR
jgi:hypothetical protein